MSSVRTTDLTAKHVSVNILTPGYQLDGERADNWTPYASPDPYAAAVVTANGHVALTLGDHGDEAVVIEGSVRELRALLRRMTKALDAHDDYVADTITTLVGTLTDADTDDVAQRFTCTEADDIARAMYATGHPDAAVDFLRNHADGDDVDPEDPDYYPVESDDVTDTHGPLRRLSYVERHHATAKAMDAQRNRNAAAHVLAL